MKYLDRVANVAIILGVCILLFMAAQNHFGAPREGSQPSPNSLVGKTVALPGIALGGQSKSLVLALSTTCHFC